LTIRYFRIMDSSQLKIFIAVMRKGSFVEVARALNKAPSSISRSVALLEEELGVRLLNRNTRQVTPTEAGNLYFQRIEPLVDELDLAAQEIHAQQRGPKGTIRVTCPASFDHVYLTPMLPGFLRQYPDVKVELLVSDSVLDMIRERVDLAIRFGHLPLSNFVATQLCDLVYIACASPGYLETAPKLTAPQDIQNHNCLTFLYPKFNISWSFLKDKEVVKVPVKGNASVTSALALVELAKVGLGIALLPQILIMKELNEGQLVNLFPEYQITATEIGAEAWLVYPSRDYLPQKTRAFMDYLKADFARQYGANRFASPL